MKIISLEPTPSPNVMKLNIDESLLQGKSYNFTLKNKQEAPKHIQEILSLEGVQGVFQVSSFIAVERHPKADWKKILTLVGKALGGPVSEEEPSSPEAEASFGEVAVELQMFKGIPIQIKLVANGEEQRVGLPERFGKAVMLIQSASKNLFFDREWIDQGVRYGSFQEVGEELVAELQAAYDPDRLQQLMNQALEETENTKEESLSTKEVRDLMAHPDWEKRFAALERINPTVEDISVLEQALKDSKLSIRRLATAYLGMIESPVALPPLYHAMKDTSPVVRRTAGDALSDLGNPEAIPVMIGALKDPNKLVRWRAARYLFEVGDASAIKALREAQHDPEFEVGLQAKMALERIERGEEASGTVWQQMTKERSKG